MLIPSSFAPTNTNYLPNPSRQSGYAALASVLVITAVALVIGMTTSLFSVNNLQSSFAQNQGEQTLAIVEGCVQDALLRLNENNALPVSITTPLGTCSVTINSQVGNTWTFTVSATAGLYTRSIQVVAVRSSSISITSWLEV